MRTLALTILTIGIVLTSGHARAQEYDPNSPCRAPANGQMRVLNPYYACAMARMKGSRSAARAETRSYVPPKSSIHSRSTPYNRSTEPYYGASQGYAPGEKQQFLESVRQSL